MVRWRGRVDASAFVAGVLVVGCGETPPEPGSMEAAGSRAEQIQKGTALPKHEALTGGHVRLEAADYKPGGKLLELCSGTMIGPRTLITAEHCVRGRKPDAPNGTPGDWSELKSTLVVREPGTPSWTPASCSLSPLVGSGESDIPQKPKLSVPKGFNLALKVAPRVSPGILRKSNVPSVCGVATLAKPRADVAIVTLPPSAPPFPGWPTKTVIDGTRLPQGKKSTYLDSGTQVRCIGFGRDTLHAPGESADGIGKSALVRLVSMPVPMGGDFLYVPVYGAGILPANPAGAVVQPMVDDGDSGGGCHVQHETGATERKLVAVATDAFGPEGARVAGLSARVDAFIPWLEQVAFTRPAMLSKPVDTVLPSSVKLPGGKFWDDADASLFLDITGDGLDDFVYFGDPARLIVVPGTGQGAFGAPSISDQLHDPRMVVEARWQGTNPATLPARGFRSRVVTATTNTSPSYEGLFLHTRFDDGTQPSYDTLVGKKWTYTPAYGAVAAGPHFNAQHESLVVQRQPDPEAPGDTGAVALLPGESSGSFLAYPARIWPVPPGYIAHVFKVADVDGDGGVDLITIAKVPEGKAFHVFRAIPGGTWATTPVSSPFAAQEGLSVCSLLGSGDVPGLVDVTNDGLVDLACANDSGIFVRAGLPDGKFSTDVRTTPFELTDRPWSNALMQDLDGDGFRDYVTIYEGALWFKLGVPAPPGAKTAGFFGGLQRVPLGVAGATNRALNTFDAARLRTNGVRSAAVVFEVAPGSFAIREMPSDVRHP